MKCHVIVTKQIVLVYWFYLLRQGKSGRCSSHGLINWTWQDGNSKVNFR